MHWTDVWYGDSFANKTARTVLTPASWGYSLIWNGYRSLYDTGFLKPAQPHSPILCVGNLTTGGSGKTPFTVFLASLLTQMGKAVVVGCSGYGSPGSERATIAPEGNIKAARWGDEAALFRYLLPDAPLIVGRDRVLAAKLCHETFPDSILLMDDGFQHLPLQKDISIILDPVPSNPRCIPAGPYRERPSKHHPIDALIPGKFWVVTSPLSLLDPRENIEVALPEEANLLCAIGTPQNFAKAVSEAGVRLKIARFLKDHSPLTNGNLFEGLSPDLPLIVTVKDWVKLRDREDIGSLRVLVARYEVSAEPAPDFATWLQQKLDEVVSKGT